MEVFNNAKLVMEVPDCILGSLEGAKAPGTVGVLWSARFPVRELHRVLV